MNDRSANLCISLEQNLTFKNLHSKGVRVNRNASSHYNGRMDPSEKIYLHWFWKIWARQIFSRIYVAGLTGQWRYWYRCLGKNCGNRTQEHNSIAVHNLEEQKNLYLMNETSHWNLTKNRLYLVFIAITLAKDFLCSISARLMEKRFTHQSSLLMSDLVTWPFTA